MAGGLRPRLWPWPVLLWLLARSGTTGLRAAQKVTPVEQVVELLKGLQSNLEAESKKEAAEYDKYACFCKEQVDEKQYAIEKSTKKIEKLTAEISLLDTEVAQLNSNIADLATSIAALEQEITEAMQQREVAHANYTAEEADISGAISSMVLALEALKESKASMSEAKVDLAQVNAAVGRALGSFASGAGPRSTSLGRLAALAQEPGDSKKYEYHSNDIISMIDDMRKEFILRKEELDTAEFNEQSAFEKRELDLQQSAKLQSNDKKEKEKIAAYKTELKEKASEEKAVEEQNMGADTQFMDVLKGDCEEKATLWDQRSSVRSGELTAIAEALAALESNVATTYDANKKLVGLQTRVTLNSRSKLQARATHVEPSFFQIHRRSTSSAGAVSRQAMIRRVGSLVSIAAQRLGSSTLAAVAARILAEEDHFVKVRSIIKDLMARLEADAQAEEGQKAFCDRQMGESIASRDSAQSEIETLAAEKSKLGAEKDQLEKDIADLSKSVSESKKALIEATDLRHGESADNVATIGTAEKGKAAVEMALTLLKDFYASAGAAALQIKYVPPNSDRSGKTVSDLAPSTFDDEYHGDQTASKGIIGLLEVILSDFERTISTVTEQEAEAATEFEKFKGETEADISAKETSASTKDDRVKEIGGLIFDNAEKMTTEEELLKTAKDQLEVLHSQCVAGEESYADRVAKREKEIESLKQALAILEGWQS